MHGPRALPYDSARMSDATVEAAEVVLPCSDLSAALPFYMERLGFRLDSISPADAPSAATLSGHGVRIRLERGVDAGPGVLRLRCRDVQRFAGGAAWLTAPNGTRVELVDADLKPVLPPLRPSLVIATMGGDSAWGQGRAGMKYRDLIPDRQGGRFIASHIQIPEAGPVPDYVHFHRVRFQMIFVRKGWVRVVYEDQGPPFVLRTGDCVLQPPQIRHRVLESSEKLEVIELSSPAQHETLADHELELPTATVRHDRLFGGQRFVRHQAGAAQWQPWRTSGFEARDTGIGEATHGLAEAHVLRPRGPGQAQPTRHEGELSFAFVLDGAATLWCEGHDAATLVGGDSCVVPPGLLHAWSECSTDFELLHVGFPGNT